METCLTTFATQPNGEPTYTHLTQQEVLDRWVSLGYSVELQPLEGRVLCRIWPARENMESAAAEGKTEAHALGLATQSLLERLPEALRAAW